jgi:murein DD-endopeptidase MepM/ murein hydrolase activator NlpD
MIAGVSAYVTATGGGLPLRVHAFEAPVAGLSLPSASSSAPATDVADRSVLRPPTINKTRRAEQPVTTEQQQVVTALALLASPSPDDPVAGEDAIVRAASVSAPLELPLYQVYQVQEGDTVSSIAARFGMDPAYIVANNAEIQDVDFLTLGQSIIIPAGNGILHEVRYGETLSDVATRYNVDIEAITSFGQNQILTPDDIAEAQVVFVPGGQPLPSAATAAAGDAAPAPAGGPAADDVAPAAGAAASAGGPNSSAGLIWPLAGPVSSYFGAGHPLGVDIDAVYLGGAAVAASTSGTVTFAGGNACCSYGLYVVIRSADGIETLYAHLNSITVVEGQSVSQGDTIGVVGSTGYSTGRHLHFEVIDNGFRADPLAYLP